jgi:hypothetical protein
VQRVAIGFAIDSDRLDTEFFTGTHDAEGNFSAIRDKNLIKHVFYSAAVTDPADRSGTVFTVPEIWIP